MHELYLKYQQAGNFQAADMKVWRPFGFFTRIRRQAASNRNKAQRTGTCGACHERLEPYYRVVPYLCLNL